MDTHSLIIIKNQTDMVDIVMETEAVIITRGFITVLLVGTMVTFMLTLACLTIAILTPITQPLLQHGTIITLLPTLIQTPIAITAGGQVVLAEEVVLAEHQAQVAQVGQVGQVAQVAQVVLAELERLVLLASVEVLEAAAQYSCLQTQ
jgi:hypothetical protein